jgi:large subunit ribosomal protein L9
MDVILLEKLGRFGGIGDRASVKAGYGRNYLIPRGKAVFATEKNIAEFESRRAELESNAADKLAVAQARADKLAAIATVTISANAGDEGKLFGSVGAREIEEAILAAGGDVNRSEVNLPEGSLRQIGTFDVDVQLHSDIVQSISVVIEQE